MMIKISLRIGNEITIPEVAEACGIFDDFQIKSLLERKIREYYALFGSEPYCIEYSRKKDSYIIRANSTIGIVNCDFFILEILPKFETLMIGKCLQMAHSSSSNNLVNHNNDICESNISDSDILNGVDYFALALNSAIQDCINGGLITSFTFYTRPDPELKGHLNINRHISTGANPLAPQTIKNSRTEDCKINSILKMALEICIIECNNHAIKSISSSLIRSFKDVSTIPVENLNISIDEITSIPRPDYERALALSEIILNGFTSTKGGRDSFTPYFTINLDYLFERYCSFEIENLMNKISYQVFVQSEKKHDFSPSIDAKKICPDIIVKSTQDSDHRSIIIDTKNKFSLSSDENISISNNDIYQIFYYSLTFQTNVGVLLYPGDDKISTSYPIMGSEGKVKYEAKRNKKIKEMLESGKDIFCKENDNQVFYLVIWRVNLSGTLQDTKESIVEFCQFIADVSTNKILC